MFKRVGTVIGLILGGLILSHAAAAQSAYEPFNYPANVAINGQNGGTGWGGPWVGFSTNVVSPGLTYAGLVTLGNALGRTPGSASTRTLATPVLGTAGKSLVLSAIIKSDVPGTNLTQATLGNSAGGTFIIGDLPELDPAANRWGMQNGAGIFYSNVPVAANVPTYLVAQIDFAVSGGNDRMRLWINPPANAYFTVPPAIDVTNAHIAQFSGVFWQTQQNQVVDEIRVQATQGACVPPPNTTMVAWYPFDETVGPAAANLATGNSGLWINGPTPVPGIVGGALHFDGISNYVAALSTIVTNFGPASSSGSCSGSFSTCPGDFSIDAWVRAPGASGTQTIADKRAGSGSAIKGYAFFLSQGSLGLQLADGAGSGFSNYISPPLNPVIGDGNWHHVTVTVKRTVPNGIRWYHNGTLFGFSNPTGRPGSLVNNSPLYIGTRYVLTGWFHGDLDELEIFNRVLTPTEVMGIFAAGPFGKCK